MSICRYFHRRYCIVKIDFSATFMCHHVNSVDTYLCIISGAMNADNCPAQPMIPIYIILLGCISLWGNIIGQLFNCFSLYCCPGPPGEEVRRWNVCGLVICLIHIAWFILGKGVFLNEYFQFRYIRIIFLNIIYNGIHLSFNLDYC